MKNPIVRLFRSPTTGAAIACRKDMPFSDGELLYKASDSEAFRELASSGFNGSSENYTSSWIEPDSQTSMRVSYDGKVFTYLDDRFVEVPVPAVWYAPIVLLPIAREPQYLFALPDGTLIYVSASKYHYSYESFRLFIGRDGVLKNVPVKEVNRYRDGGTTFVKTASGELYSPTPFKKDVKATWKKQELTKLDPALYEIHEDENSVRIKLR